MLLRRAKLTSFSLDERCEWWVVGGGWWVVGGGWWVVNGEWQALTLRTRFALSRAHLFGDDADAVEPDVDEPD